MPTDDRTQDLVALSWKPADVENSLRVLREYVESQASGSLRWYYAKKIWKARMSSFLRALTIFFFTCGGLVPLIKAIAPPGAPFINSKDGFDFGQLGYLLIAIAAAAIALDRFFGFSSGWIRYITTALSIERSLDEFRLEWARVTATLQGNQPSPEKLDDLVQLCKTFSIGIRGQVEQETKAWVLEFQSNLSELEKELKAKAREAETPAQVKGATAGV
jgi:hypothetical protein